MSAATDRLERFHAAVAGMTQDEREDFRISVIAALAATSADEPWDEALAFARSLVEKRRAECS